MVIDINGYFAPPTSAANGLSFYPVSPVRIFDSRFLTTDNGHFPSSISSRTIPGSTYFPDAFALATNITVVPNGPLSYLSAWNSTGFQPYVSTLNSFDGRIVANAAIIPSTRGDFNVLTLTGTNAGSDVVIDVAGYFAPGP